MPRTREQLIEANKLAVQSPSIGKHGKWKKTLEKEKRQQIFDEIVSQEFITLIKQAKAEYKLDRFMGKVPEEHNIHIGDKVIDNTALDEASKLYGTTVTKRKTN